MSTEIGNRTRKSLVVITGGSSGIGAAFARRLAPEHSLLLVARRKERLEQLASELSKTYGTQVEVMAADLTVEQDLAAVAERLERAQDLALLVNNAGFGSRGRFWESPIETQEQMHRLHVLAPLRLTHAALRNMVLHDFGGIINVASVAAFIRSSGNTSYCSTKSWMTAFTETLHLELRSIRSNVAIQALCPGYTYSEFHDTLGVSREKLAPRSFWMTAEEVVDASLEGLRRHQLFVVPGWRYRLLTSLLSKIPTRLRLNVEAAATKARSGQLTSSKQEPAGIGPSGADQARDR
jgi:Short-chain dehydrogenases of various substrate specificities